MYQKAPTRRVCFWPTIVEHSQCFSAAFKKCLDLRPLRPWLCVIKVMLEEQTALPKTEETKIRSPIYVNPNR